MFLFGCSRVGQRCVVAELPLVVTSDGFPQVQQTVHPINDLEEQKVSSINRYCQHETGPGLHSRGAACLPATSRATLTIVKKSENPEL